MNQMLGGGGGGTQTFTVAGYALRSKANLYNSYELGNTAFKSKINAICFKQETGTLHYMYNNVHAQSQSKGHPGCFVVHISVQLY